MQIEEEASKAAESLSEFHIRMTHCYAAHNYAPSPVVFCRGKGVFLWDVEGKRYLDLLGAYSAANLGHCHPKVVQALVEQAQTLDSPSRAAYHDKLWRPLERLAQLTGLETFLPMNSGAEGVETGLKCIRKYGREVMKKKKPRIILADRFYHGRMLSVVTNSRNPSQSQGYGPRMPGFDVIPYNDLGALEHAITRQTAAFMVEPIQGNAGIILPDEDYLPCAREICHRHGILFVLDEVQTGLGRTGKMFCYEHSGATPDLLILGKALGGNLFPVSILGGRKEIMDIFTPDSHGSTFGGNPLAMAVADAALGVLVEEKLAEKAAELGLYALERLRDIKSPLIKEVRGKGLFMAIELHEPKAHEVVKKLLETEPDGVFCKDAHKYTVRFGPPLVITKEEIDLAVDYITGVFEKDYS